MSALSALRAPGRRRLLWVFAAVLVLAAATAAATGLFPFRDDGGAGIVTAPDKEFTILRPEGWSEVPAQRRDALPGRPVVVLRQEGGHGLVVVSAQSQAAGDLDKVGTRLDSQLEKAIPDFRKVSARKVQTKSGEALLYSYARTQRGTAHTLLVVLTGSGSYTLSAVVSAGADDQAREAGRILFSFDLRGPQPTP
jgi:hypothetical protein